VHGALDPKQREDLGRIDRSAQHLLGLINDILNFAKIEAGRLQLSPKPTRLHQTLEQLEALVTPQLLERKLTYEYQPIDEAETAFVDSERFQQILLNLLSNAVKFTPEGGRVVVDVAFSERDALVRVSDTGAGIPDDKLEAIFEPFVQVDRARWQQHAGTGLGLAISRDLARAMGGDLTVESAIDVGSTFTVRVPRSGPS
jgi:signal transduction histidine kinase